MLIFAFVAIAVVLAVMARYGDKPTEFSAEVWDADPAKRSHNLKMARAAWRAGRVYVNPDRLNDMMSRARAANGPIVIANPKAEKTKRRLVRCCAMHAPRWE